MIEAAFKKYVARKQRQREQFGPIFPAPGGRVQREKRLKSSARENVSYCLLVLMTRVDRMPRRLRTVCRFSAGRCDLLTCSSALYLQATILQVLKKPLLMAGARLHGRLAEPTASVQLVCQVCIFQIFQISAHQLVALVEHGKSVVRSDPSKLIPSESPPPACATEGSCPIRR